MIDAIGTGVSSLVASTTLLFTNNLGSVFGVFGVLIGLGLLIRLIKRFIGRRA